MRSIGKTTLQCFGMTCVGLSLMLGQVRNNPNQNRSDFRPITYEDGSLSPGSKAVLAYDTDSSSENLATSAGDPNVTALNPQNRARLLKMAMANEVGGNGVNGIPGNAATSVGLNAYDWRATPTSPSAISAGSNTITLPTCPVGVDVTHLNVGLVGVAGWYVRFPDHGTDEVGLITGGTCKPGMNNGTVIVTVPSPHTAGYTVESASDGLQEAINDSCHRAPAGDSQPVLFGGEFKINPQRLVEIYGTVILSCTDQTVDLSGALLRSHVAGNKPTIYVGIPGHHPSIPNGVTLINPSAQPAVAGNTGPFIEDNATRTRIYNVIPLYPWGNRKATFGTIVQVDDDEAFLLDGLDTTLMLSGIGLTPCDSHGCPSAITSVQGAAVGWLKHLNLSLGCAANGINWRSGNGVHVSDAVIQAYSQFGIWAHSTYGAGVNVFDNVYNEVGRCTNPVGTGIAPVICQNGACIFHQGNSSSGGALPEYSCTTSGKVQTYYYAVATYPGGHASEPYLAGHSSTDGTGRCTIKFPRFGSGVTGYDLLSLPGEANMGPPSGKGNYARQTALDPNALCSGTGDNEVCSVTDDTSRASSSYTVIADRGASLKFWPGAIVTTGTGNLGAWDKIITDRYYQGAVVSALGLTATSVYASNCDYLAGASVYNDTIVDCRGPRATLSLATTPIPAGACGKPQTASFAFPISFPRSVVHWSFASSTENVAGWNRGGLTLNVFPVYPKSAGAIICNTTGASITPGAIAVNFSIENP